MTPCVISCQIQQLASCPCFCCASSLLALPRRDPQQPQCTGAQGSVEVEMPFPTLPPSPFKHFHCHSEKNSTLHMLSSELRPLKLPVLVQEAAPRPERSSSQGGCPGHSPALPWAAWRLTQGIELHWCHQHLPAFSILFPAKGTGPFGSSLCMVLQPPEIAFLLTAPWTRSWKPSTEILPNQSCGEDSHANLTQLGTSHAHAVQLDPQVPILFLLRVKAVSIPETQTDFSSYLFFNGLSSP